MIVIGVPTGPLVGVTVTVRSVMNPPWAYLDAVDDGVDVVQAAPVLGTLSDTLKAPLALVVVVSSTTANSVSERPR